MILGGVFERFPRLRVAFAHGGGSFPFTIGRIEHEIACGRLAHRHVDRGWQPGFLRLIEGRRDLIRVNVQHHERRGLLLGG